MDNRLNALNISIFPAIGRVEYDAIASLNEEQRKQYYAARKERLKIPYGDGKPGLAVVSNTPASLREVYQMITNPAQMIAQGGKGAANATIKDLTDFVRAGDYNARKYYLLPHAVFAGIPVRIVEDKAGQLVRQCYRNKANFNPETPGVVFSNYVIIDLDHLKDAGADLETLRERVAADTEIGARLIFVSPSLDGLKVVCESKRGFTSDNEFKREIAALAHYFNTRLLRDIPKLKVDPSGKDICRTCFLCYDAEARLLDTPYLFDSEKHPAPTREQPRREPVQYQGGGYADDAEAAEMLVRKVEEARAAICNEEGEYFKVITAFSALGERGRELAHRVCSLSDKYDAARLDTDFDYSLKRYGATANIGVFFAMCKDNGILLYNPAETGQISRYKMNYKERYQQGEKAPKTAQDYAYMWEPETEEDIIRYIGEDSGGMGTGYYIYSSEGDREELKLPVDGLTLVCGLPGHCKSVLLRNLALRLALSQRPGDILYFSYEESKRKTDLRLLNTLIGVELNKGRNTDAIRDFCKTGEDRFISQGAKETFHEKLTQYQELRASGKLRVYSPTYTAAELVEAVGAYQESTGRAVSAVFVDYIQFVQSGRDLNRREDILEVATRLLNLAKTGIPVIAAAQLNRETKNPAMLNGSRIAESQDLTRHADTIISLWNSQKSDDLDADGMGEPDRKKFFDFIDGKPGKVYLVVNKSRENEPGQWAILNFNGKTGLIGQHPDGAIDDLPDEFSGGWTNDFSKLNI